MSHHHPFPLKAPSPRQRHCPALPPHRALQLGLKRSFCAMARSAVSTSFTTRRQHVRHARVAEPSDFILELLLHRFDVRLAPAA